ncbi:NAD(P)/FAD-dependent oxidoreductase [Enterococcus sp. BWB1-3]|uniref:phytoene desaturase family protein n=1 Tax=unclassified Enterococcus TaxID=2608891 RepID=UPI001923335E|nr:MULTISPECIES: NAD(P)/FAD-dependent oxidoreductase [unclassified Enterococcus]MBL1228796.1 NAD(P)/FAD-dependent oxidoreductase [Enterococcus sp. BWB1-3]MCB5953721.1 NAD(P)/FAD-dependent oxidoreductase [Enterococcus sp. CWB-B31]
MKKIAVIGSGYSGLTCAALLAKQGYNVELFEKHSVLGGYGDGFEKKGFTFHTSVYRFPSTVYTILDQVLDLTYDNFLYYYMQYHINDRKILIDDDLLNVLRREFPHQRVNVEQFKEKMNDVLDILNEIDQSGGNILSISVERLKEYLIFTKRTIETVLIEFFGEDALFANVFYALFDLTADMSAITIPATLCVGKDTPENKMVFGGGKQVIADLETLFLQFEGTIHRRKEVSATLIDDGSLTELQFKNGETYSNFDYVVWANDYNNFYRLNNEQYWNPKLRNDFIPSSSSFGIWLGLDQPFESLGISETYHSIYIGDRTFYSKVAQQKIPVETEFLMVSFLYSKDSKSTPENKSQLCLGFAMNFDFMKECQTHGIYKDVKKEIEELFIALLKEYFPIIDETKVICKASATPLTYERYTHNRKGSMYGFEKKQEFVISSQRHETTNTSIKNLFFCSQWTSIAGGTYGAVKEGIRAANHILSLDNKETYQYQE